MKKKLLTLIGELRPGKLWKFPCKRCTSMQMQVGGSDKNPWQTIGYHSFNPMFKGPPRFGKIVQSSLTFTALAASKHDKFLGGSPKGRETAGISVES